MAPNSAQKKAAPLDRNWEALKCILPENIVGELSSNHPPCTAAFQFAKAVSADPSALLQATKLRVCKLDEEIGKLQAEKAILADESFVRDSLKELCGAISSPIRRIPDDIIREILQHVTKDTSHPSPERNSAPLSLARVCSAWRSVALSSPRLWSTLYLRIKDISHHGIKRYYQAVETWFHRAQTLPLQLFLYFDFDETPAKPTPFSSYIISIFLNAVAPWTSRIHRLGIGSQDWAGLMQHFAGIDWDLSNLRRLDILGQKNFDPDLIEDGMPLESAMKRISIFQKSSLLTTVVAVQEISVYLDQLAFIPWRQITSISWHEEQCELPHFSSLTRFCPLLENARLHMDAEYSRSPLPSPPFSHAHLKTLELWLKTPDYAGVVDLFTHNIFPHLEFLHLYIIEANGGRPCITGGAFGKFVPLPSLSTLILRGEPLPTRFVLDILLNCPLLKTLDICIDDGPKKVPMTDVNKLCQRMTIENGHCNLVPFLEECTFQYEGLDYRAPFKSFILDSTRVSRFVHSRTQNLPPKFSCLKRVAFTGGFQFLTDIHRDIAMLALPSIIQSSKVEVIMQQRGDRHSTPWHFIPGLHVAPFEPEVQRYFREFAYSVNHRQTLDM
ncbi:hypothetical protein D9619_001312 [Psilocybe cf. subviscida]|uniref:F-box domain-containing protein n=1 Tax=Psilocybe cf. subviscida TaxID=2480587 RepID=A0A8H5BE82_9AGAR|nr:hypothetical protein D9619_001312 [Psilocybe cf. subviscida]